MGLGLCQREGQVQSLANIHNRCWRPLLNAAGIRSEYKLYALRHYHASALIDDGANPKEVQVEMGHSAISVTFDVYWPPIPRRGCKQQRSKDGPSVWMAERDMKRDIEGRKRRNQRLKGKDSSFPSYVSRVRFPSPAPTFSIPYQ